MFNKKNKNIVKINTFIYSILLIAMAGGLSVPAIYVWAQMSNIPPEYIDASLSELNKEIAAKRKEVEEMNKKIATYQASIRKKQRERVTLKNQLEILNEQIDKINLEIRKIQIQINQINLEIQANEEKIKQTEKRIQTLREQIAEMIRTLYKEDDKTYLEAVVLYSSLSDFINQLTYLEGLENDLKINLDQVKLSKQELDKERENLRQRQLQLKQVKRELEEKKAKLESTQITKENLLAQTRRDEARYKYLIERERALYEQINNEIKRLEKTIREKMKDTGKLGSVADGFIWPVPSHYITSYFRDPDYPYRKVFEHPAIDIRAKHGTPVKAVASGYVARVREAGIGGYSYVMIVHDQGLSTVYGHISKALVQEGTYVVQGQTIALSGGTPGTPGAGRFTTGPHLHLEFRLNGIPVNPLLYLTP